MRTRPAPPHRVPARFHFLLLVSSLLVSCVSSPPFRQVGPGSVVNAGTYSPADAARIAEKAQIEKYPKSNFWLAHVEFDDFGTLADHRQLREIERHVLGQGGSLFKNGITVIAFVHGWHNNASRDNDDLASFRAALAELSAKERQAGRGVLGVYLSWRGELTTVPVMRHLTYWSRKATAHSIGHGNLSEALVRLRNINVVLADRNTVGFEQYYANTRLVLVGHSFGAAALYSALADPVKVDFMQAYYRAKEDRRASPKRMSMVTGIGDLVLLINPAFEALQYRVFEHHIRHNMTVDYAPYQPVLMMIVGSEADGANQRLFPIGQAVGNAGRLITARRAEGEVASNEKQGWQLVTSVGSWKEFATHRLRPGEDGKGTLLEIEPHAKPKDQIKKFLSAPNPTPSGQPLTPFMVVRAQANFMGNHSDIWQRDFRKFIVDFVGAQSNWRHAPQAKLKQAARLQSR